jgi:hypothetical protein
VIRQQIRDNVSVPTGVRQGGRHSRLSKPRTDPLMSEWACQHRAMNRVPALRATAESGDTIDDPSEDALFIMFEDIEAGETSFLIVDRLADASGQTYVQTSRNVDGSYIVEYRDGGPEHHHGTVVNDMRSAHSLVTGWAFERPRWRESAEWRRVET